MRMFMSARTILRVLVAAAQCSLFYVCTCDTGHTQIREPIPGIRDTRTRIPDNQTYRQFPFQIDFGSGSGRQLNSGFRECVGLETIGPTAVGSGSKRPIKISLSKGVIPRQLFTEWLLPMRNGTLKGARTIVIRMMNADLTRAVRTWRLLGAHIVNYSAPELGATGGAEVNIESMELTYEELES